MMRMSARMRTSCALSNSTSSSSELATFDLNALADASEGFSGAEIEEAIISALYDAFYAKQELTTAHVLASLSQTVPLAKTMSEKINAQRSWAVGRARNASVIRPLPAGNDTARHMEL